MSSPITLDSSSDSDETAAEMPVLRLQQQSVCSGSSMAVDGTLSNTAFDGTVSNGGQDIVFDEPVNNLKPSKFSFMSEEIIYNSTH